jgi:hypothetical protein
MTNIPDDQALREVDRDHPNASDAEKYRLAQAVMLLRASGHTRQRDGSYTPVKTPSAPAAPKGGN